LEGGKTVSVQDQSVGHELQLGDLWNFPPGWALATVFVNGISKAPAASST